MNWISVKDRLPENERTVLVYYNFGGKCKISFYGTLTYYAFDPEPHWQHESTGLKVTHWMPLPEPPEEEDTKEVSVDKVWDDKLFRDKWLNVK